MIIDDLHELIEKYEPYYNNMIIDVELGKEYYFIGIVDTIDDFYYLIYNEDKKEHKFVSCVIDLFEIYKLKNSYINTVDDSIVVKPIKPEDVKNNVLRELQVPNIIINKINELIIKNIKLCSYGFSSIVFENDIMTEIYDSSIISSIETLYNASGWCVEYKPKLINNPFSLAYFSFEYFEKK